MPGTGDDGLEQLPSKQLYDLAVSYAKRHLDLRFFWDVMRLLPAAEAAAVVGGGTPLLPPLTEGIPLDLIETRTFGSRVIYEQRSRL